jgi:hypothetical protein
MGGNPLLDQRLLIRRSNHECISHRHLHPTRIAGAITQTVKHATLELRAMVLGSPLGDLVSKLVQAVVEATMIATHITLQRSEQAV